MATTATMNVQMRLRRGWVLSLARAAGFVSPRLGRWVLNLVFDIPRCEYRYSQRGKWLSLGSPRDLLEIV